MSRAYAFMVVTALSSVAAAQSTRIVVDTSLLPRNAPRAIALDAVTLPAARPGAAVPATWSHARDDYSTHCLDHRLGDARSVDTGIWETTRIVDGPSPHVDTATVSVVDGVLKPTVAERVDVALVARIAPEVAVWGHRQADMVVLFYAADAANTFMGTYGCTIDRLEVALAGSAFVRFTSSSDSVKWLMKTFYGMAAPVWSGVDFTAFVSVSRSASDAAPLFVLGWQ